MAIRDSSGVPDHTIPDWLLQSRLRLRDEAEKYRKNKEYFEKRLALSQKSPKNCGLSGHRNRRYEVMGFRVSHSTRVKGPHRCDECYNESETLVFLDYCAIAVCADCLSKALGLLNASLVQLKAGEKE